MKTNSYQQPKRRRRGRFSPVTWTVFSLVVVLALLLTLKPGLVEGVVVELVYPLWKAGGSVGESVATITGSLRTKASLVEENRALRDAYERTTAPLLLRNRVLEMENKELKRLLGRKRFDAVVLAPVLRTPPGTFYDTLLIDVGVHTGVAVGNRVTVDGSIVIGRLSSIAGRVGEVSLFSTPGVETEVLVNATSTGIRIMAVGRGAGNFSADVPKELDIAVGDPIVFPSLSPLVFAEVARVESDSAAPFETVFFKNPVNFNTLHFVEVITDNEEVSHEPGGLEPAGLVPEAPSFDVSTSTPPEDTSDVGDNTTDINL